MIKAQSTMRGFTLTELLVTITTIGVLAGILMPALNKARLYAKDMECLNQQRNNFVALHNVVNEVVQDFTIKKNENFDNIEKFFIRDYVQPLIKDYEFKELGVYISKPLTCPYSSDNKKARVPFRVISIKEFPEERNNAVFNGINYITYNYGLEIEHLNLSRNGNNEFAIVDLLNLDLKEKTTVGRWFSGVSSDSIEKYANQSISFDSSSLHRHKGKGLYATFGSGAQRWVSDKELNVTEVTPRLKGADQ